jgi:guanosine-3',5'-bis(diphosphate) 3'-pyrophosphohydrolase
MIRFDDILEKVSSSYSEKDILLLKKAYIFAAQAHKGQTRRSGEPYLSHSLEVAGMLADMKLDKITLVAGLLHDVLEDTDVTSPDLVHAFGKETTHLVEGVTKISRIQESSPETRQAESIRKVILAMTDDLRVIFVKLADRIHNLKTLKFLPEDKQKQIANETLEIYAPIANRLGMGKIKAELEDLSFRYVNPDDYFKVASLVEPQRGRAEKELKKTKRALEKLMKENNIPAEITYRIKRHYSIYNKMKKQNTPFDQVFDFIALRLVVDSPQNCYSALGVIHQNWPHLPHRFRDFIAMPKPNLYQSLHTTIIPESKRTIEIQIRTQDMHNLAENGIAAHWKYKETSPEVMREDRRLHWLREMVGFYKEQKSSKEFLKSLKTNLVPEDVYVFTPKGKVVTLPIGASALDFAFKIHSEIGLHSSAAKINYKAAPLKTILKSGDIVEITTSPEKTPRRDWLNIAFTSTARHQIKHWLNLQDKIKTKALGRKLWEREIKKYKIPSDLLKESNLIRAISSMTNFRIKKIEEFYSLLGFGKIIVDKKFLERLFPSEEIIEKKETFLKKVVKRVAKKPKPAIAIKGIKLAKCCSPIKGEPITGYITSGKGITVHSLRCPLIAKEILDDQRKIEVSWEDAPEQIYKGKLLITSENSRGLLAKLASGIAELGGDISKAEVKTFADNNALFKISVIIPDIEHFEAIAKEISRIKEVISVKRV